MKKAVNDKKEERWNDIEFQTPQQAIDYLTSKGYDRDAQWRYAKAARSWKERGSKEWDLWRHVEQMTSQEGST